MKKIVLLLLLLCAHPVLAVTPFIITDIRVEGLERLEAGTIFNYLPLKVGDELNDEEARLSIKELFSTGFFKDVALEQDGTVLVVKVVERPSISELEITGNKVLDSAAIEDVLEQVGLVQGRIFNSASLDRVEQELKNTYLSLGRYSATVESEVEELDRNRVAIRLKVNEGRVATIKKINIIGAKAIPVKKIIAEMSLRDTRGFLSGRDQYSKQKLEADIEAIRSYYLDRGFHDFKIADRSVDISPNKQSIFISISLVEGVRYVFGETVFEAAAETPVTDLEKLTTITPGKSFSRKVVNASRVAITQKYADAGYAFVNVRPIYEADPAAKVVKTVFVIEPKQRVYVRKVEITGNLHTRDQVIRRELRQFEGSWYSAVAVSRSRSRLRRLGYFQDVTIETPTVPGTTDQVDMKVVVKERNTGAISFSLGYSDVDGTLVGLAYSQRNLLGTGRELRVALDTSDAARTAEIVYVDPYHTPDGVSRGFSLSRRQVDTDEVNSAEYVVNTTAVGLNYKIPITETNSFNLGFTLEEVDLEATSQTPFEFQRVIDDQLVDDESRGVNLLARFGVSKDTRDDFFFPTSGASGSVSVDVASPGSDYEYYKLNLQGAYYVPLTERFTVKGGVGLGFGGGFGDSDELPFFRRYFAGGTNSVRGFDGRSLGPLSSGFANCRPPPPPMPPTMPPTIPPPPALPNDTDCTPVVREPVGGDKRLLVNAELLFPPFGADAGKDKRFSLFIDGGSVFGEGYVRDEDNVAGGGFSKIKDTGFDFDELRYSAGVSFNWFSPIGPFSMSYAEPLNKETGDETENFQITVGSVFR